MATFQENPTYCITFGNKDRVDYKQASNLLSLQSIVRNMRKATAPRKRSLFLIVYKHNRMIYRCWRGCAGESAMRDWGLLYE